MPVRVADLHQDGEAAAGRMPGEHPVQDGHAVPAIDVAVGLEAGVGAEFGGQPGDARLVHEFVGQQQARETKPTGRPA